VKSKHSNRAFNVLDDADGLIREIWRADIPPFKSDASLSPDAFFPDDPVIVETMRTLAELVFYSKQRARSPAQEGRGDWMQAKFSKYDPAKYLPGMEQLLEQHFGELIGRGQPTHAKAQDHVESHAHTDFMANHFYIRAYSKIPEKDDVEAYLLACGIGPQERPESFDFLLQAYYRTHVRLDRLVTLSHLIIAGAQSDTDVSHDTLVHEHKLQALLKELRASYITEYSTMRLAFAKRPFGLSMLSKLSAYSGFDAKHDMALTVIKERLHVGVEQFPLIVHATHKTQRLFKTIGQVLLGGFLATEVVKSLNDWASVIFHKNTAAYFIDLEKTKSPVLTERMDALLDQYNRFEMIAVYGSILTVVAVIGVTIYFKVRERSLLIQDESASLHHH
jgi:hypothetical protein